MALLAYSTRQWLPILLCIRSVDIHWVPNMCHCSRCPGCCSEQSGLCPCEAHMLIVGNSSQISRDMAPYEKAMSAEEQYLERVGGLLVYPRCSGNSSLARGHLSGDLTRAQPHTPSLGLPGLREPPLPVSDSPSRSLLHHSAPGTLAFLLFLKPAKLVPTSEPFRFPFLLPGNLFLQISARLASSPHSGLCSSVVLSEAPPQSPCLCNTPAHRSSLCPPSTLQHDILLY